MSARGSSQSKRLMDSERDALQDASMSEQIASSMEWEVREVTIRERMSHEMEHEWAEWWAKIRQEEPGVWASQEAELFDEAESSASK